VAWEFGVPAVVGAADAVRPFPPGSRIAVDGTGGDVRAEAAPRHSTSARLRWLEETADRTYALVPVLIVTGILLSGLTWLVQRIASATARRGVFVHCGAGVGRTGTVAAAHLVESGEQSPGTAVRRNFAVGPPSSEQIYYGPSLGRDRLRQPPFPVAAVSRLVDAPRRMWPGRDARA
jgi:hypothetical protein